MGVLRGWEVLHAPLFLNSLMNEQQKASWGFPTCSWVGGGRGQICANISLDFEWLNHTSARNPWLVYPTDYHSVTLQSCSILCVIDYRGYNIKYIMFVRIYFVRNLLKYQPSKAH